MEPKELERFLVESCYCWDMRIKGYNLSSCLRHTYDAFRMAKNTKAEDHVLIAYIYRNIGSICKRGASQT